MMAAMNGRNRQSSRHLTDVLHSMMLRSRQPHEHARAEHKSGRGPLFNNKLPTGDPPETTLWGES